MKLFTLPLHVQILSGLVLGAIFGVLFSVDNQLIILTTGSDEDEREIELYHWDSVILKATDKQHTFGASQQTEIMTGFSRMRAQNVTIDVEATVSGSDITYTNVRKMRREQTIATIIKPLGDIFIRLLMMIAIPLVFASLLVGVSSLHDVRRMARIGGKTIAYYIATTALAIVIGLAFGNIIQPGEQMESGARDRLLAAYQEDASARIQENLSIDVVDYLVNLVSKNPFRALADAEMLQIIVFALLTGIALLFIDKKKAYQVTSFFDGISDAMIALVGLIMRIAPYAVFALIAATIAEFGFGVLQTLIWYVVTVLAGLFVQTFLVYPLLLKTAARSVRVQDFLRGIRPAQLVAFTTSSSAATLPVTMDCCEKIGAPKSVTSFVLPLGATINMDGTALYQGVAAVFIAQVYGMDLSIAQQLTIVLTATLASIGTAPVPGVGIVMLIIVLRSVGIPETGIALILGVDRILDMCRTITNTTSDAAVAMIVSSSEGVYKRPAR